MDSVETVLWGADGIAIGNGKVDRGRRNRRKDRNDKEWRARSIDGSNEKNQQCANR